MIRTVGALLVSIFFTFQCAFAEDAQELIRRAVEYWRGTTSHARAHMTVHRPDWSRTMAFEGWTKGDDDSLVRFTEPAKDAGNASLSVRKEMWSFSPKVSKVIKIPPSMMHQSWMGSDFSHSDLSKQTDIITEYNHTLKAIEMSEGKKVYVVESIPKESSAIVWGKEVLKIREDYLILERSFFDQDMKLVKRLTASDFRPSGKRLYAHLVRMQKAEVPEEWTEIVHDVMEFDIPIADSLFTLSHLSNPRG